MVKPATDLSDEGLRITNFYNVAEGTTSNSLTSASQILPPDYSETFRINTQGQATAAGRSSFRTEYPKFCTIRYDRYKRDARIFWDVAAPSPSAPLIMIGDPPPKPKE
jgi:hypothetical protein